MEDRYDETDIGSMAGARVRIIVHDDITRLNGFAPFGEDTQNPADITGNGARLQRGGLCRFC